MSREQIIEDLLAKRSIDAEDVLRLRQEVYKDGVIDRTDVEAVFELDRTCQNKDAAWEEFYVDELTYYFVFKAQPRGYVNQENAKFLMDQVIYDGRIGVAELELLINIIDSARSCPDQLVDFVLDKVKESVLSPDTGTYGRGRSAGIITPVDVEIIRTVIHAGGGFGAYTVTRREADLLFDLNEATVEAENAESWRDLFVKGVGSYLMFPLAAPVVPVAEEVLRRDAWLEKRRTYGAFLKELGQALRNFKVGESIKEVDLFGSRRAGQEAARQQTMASEAMGRESIDEAEAKWLIDRLDRPGALTENERALLVFIRQNSPQIHPLLNKLFAKASL